MKITDPNIIKIGESDLINAIKEKLDWNAIENLNRDKMKSPALECTKGDIVVHDNQVAYKLDFELKTGFSVLFDREGNIIQSETDEPTHLSVGSPVEVSSDIHTPDISDDLLNDFEKEMDEPGAAQEDDFSLSASDLLDGANDSQQNELSNILDLDGIPDDFDTADTERSLVDTLVDDFPAPEAIETSEGGSLLEDMDLSDLNDLEDIDIPQSDDGLGDVDIDELLELGQNDADSTDIESLLEEELKLPSDEALGILEQKVDTTKNEIQAAMQKSQNFWNQAEKPSSLSPENDMLKNALSQSKNFWTSGDTTEPASEPSLVETPEQPASKDILKKAFLRSQNFWLQK